MNLKGIVDSNTQTEQKGTIESPLQHGKYIMQASANMKEAFQMKKSK